MREIRITVEDEEFSRLEKIKGDTSLSWHEFILNLLADREFFTNGNLTFIKGDLYVTGKIKTRDSEIE